jgi:hypothetical protein
LQHRYYSLNIHNPIENAEVEITIEAFKSLLNQIAHYRMSAVASDIASAWSLREPFYPPATWVDVRADRASDEMLSMELAGYVNKQRKNALEAGRKIKEMKDKGEQVTSA